MKRTEQREHIFKLIFGADFNEEAEQGTQAELYFEQIEGATEKDMQYISEKAQKVVEKIDEIDAMINEHTTGWKTGRMNKVDLTILRLAVYEMKVGTRMSRQVLQSTKLSILRRNTAVKTVHHL